MAVILTTSSMATGQAVPTITTEPATDVGSTSVSFHATVNPNGLVVAVNFDYGTTTSYGSVVGFPWTFTGTSPIPVNSRTASLSPNTTYHYRARVNGGPGGAVYGEDVTFTTLPPSVPRIEFPTVSRITSASALLYASVLPNGLDTTAYFEWGRTTSYGITTAPQSIKGDAGVKDVWEPLAGLLPSTTYHFRGRAENSAGTSYGTDQSFTTMPFPQAPSVSTGTPEGITANSATLRGVVNPFGLDTFAYFRWGTTSAYGNTTTPQPVGNGISSSLVSTPLTGLSPGTQYHYQIVATNSMGTTFASNDVAFISGGFWDGYPIVVTLLPWVNFTTRATLYGAVTPNGSETTAYYRWGISTSYGNTTPSRIYGPGGSNFLFLADLSQLSPNTTYHIQLVATNRSGTSYANDVTIRTAPSLQPLTVLTTPPTDVTPNFARLHGAVNPNSRPLVNIFFQWGTTTEYGNSTQAQSVNGVPESIEHTAPIFSLSPNTTYHYATVMKISSGAPIVGNDMVFTTPVVGLGPTITSEPLTDITASGATLRGTVNPNGSLTTVYIRQGIYPFPDTSNRTPPQYIGDGLSPVTVTFPVTLSPGPYNHYQIVAMNNQGTQYGNDLTATGLYVGSAPTAQTFTLDKITSSTAILVGFVFSNYLETSYYFRWGTSTGYGNATSTFSAGNGQGILVAVEIQGLSPGTEYHYQLVATNSLGTNSGEDVVFNTPPSGCPVAPINIGSLYLYTSTLTPSSCRSLSRGNSYYANLYQITLKAGARIYVSVTSSDLDTVAYLLGPSGKVVASDDNGGGGTNSRIPPTSGFVTLTQSGTYIFEVTSAQAGAIGNYQLRVGVPSGPISTMTLSLTGVGVATGSSSGSNPNVRAGYALAYGSSTQDKGSDENSISGNGPYGTAVFSLRQNGVVVSEAGVPASPLTTQARIFIDYRTNVAGKNGYSDAGTLSLINTGLAAVNMGTQNARVQFILRGADGSQVLAQGSGTIIPRDHFAKFISELKDIAPDFNLPVDFPTAIQFGSLEVMSDQPLSIVALRLTTNQRNETLLTTTPVADMTQTLTDATVIFPHFADGAGNQTTVFLLNTSEIAQTGRLRFFDNNGGPQSVHLSGTLEGTGDSFDYNIPANGFLRVQTDGTPLTILTGSVEVIPDSNSKAPVGSLIFSLTQGGVLNAESGVPAAILTTHARVYLDLSGGHNTGLALAAPGTGPVNATITAFLTDGVTPIGQTGAINLNANGHDAKFANELISGLQPGLTGVMEIVSSTPFAATTLRSLTNSRNEFLITTFPVADLNLLPTNPIVFPQFVDGGGYQTQIILMGSGGTTTAGIAFYGDNGGPIAVGKIGNR